MAAIDDIEIPSLLFAEQGSAPATPASGFGRIYAKADGLYFKGDDGTEVGPFAANPGAGGSTPFKRTVYEGTGNKTTTSSTFAAIDATNLGYLTLTLDVGDVVRFMFNATGFMSTSSEFMAIDCAVDQPTSADTRIGPGDAGLMASQPNLRVPIAAVGYFTATEAGSHGFRPVWKTTGGTATLSNTASGNENVPITFSVENLGAPS